MAQPNGRSQTRSENNSRSRSRTPGSDAEQDPLVAYRRELARIEARLNTSGPPSTGIIGAVPPGFGRNTSPRPSNDVQQIAMAANGVFTGPRNQANGVAGMANTGRGTSPQRPSTATPTGPATRPNGTGPRRRITDQDAANIRAMMHFASQRRDMEYRAGTLEANEQQRRLLRSLEQRRAEQAAADRAAEGGNWTTGSGPSNGAQQRR